MNRAVTLAIAIAVALAFISIILLHVIAEISNTKPQVYLAPEDFSGPVFVFFEQSDGVDVAADPLAIAVPVLRNSVNSTFTFHRKFMKIRESVSNVVVALASGAFMALYPANAEAKKNPNNICRQLRSIQPVALLIDSSGEAAGSGFRLDALAPSKRPGKGDYLFGAEEFYLILSPAHLSVEDMCSLGQCVEVRRVKSRCPNTREYRVHIGINPQKYPPGTFTSEIDLGIEDPSSDFPSSTTIRYLFKSVATGSVTKGWLTISNQVEIENEISQLLRGVISEISLTLFNAGNRAVHLNSLGDELGAPNFRLDGSSCLSKTLEPSSACTLKLARVTINEQVNDLNTWWLAGSINGSTHRLSIRKTGIDSFSVSIDNR